MAVFCLGYAAGGSEPQVSVTRSIFKTNHSLTQEYPQYEFINKINGKRKSMWHKALQTINSMRIQTDMLGKGNQGNFYKGDYIEINRYLIR